MDPASLIGVGLALFAVFGSMIMEGGNPAAIILPPALILVFVGTLGATMATGLLRDFTGSMGAISKALFGKVSDAESSIATVVGFADRARREGLLALEESARNAPDPFLRKGIELAVDGTDPEELREILEGEIAAKKAADKVHTKFFSDMGAFAPTYGIIGTVLGLIHVLENLNDPGKLGHLIAGAFVATLWGVLTANAIWLPLAKKLARISETEIRQMHVVLEGVLSVQAGLHPRVLEQKLLSLVSPGGRPTPAVEEKAA
jgi:chemotaxis protein MotA